MNENVLAMKSAVVACMGAVGSLIGWKGIVILAWVSLMLLDYLTGTFAAMKAGKWSSAKAREGAWHKCGAIIVIVVAAIADGIMLVICGNIPVRDITWPFGAYFIILLIGCLQYGTGELQTISCKTPFHFCFTLPM